MSGRRGLRSLAYLFLVGGALVALGGCASGVTHLSSYQYGGQKFRAAKVTLSASTLEKLGGNLKFDPERLEKNVLRALESRRLIDPTAQHTIEIEVTDIRVRSTLSAVVFGFLAGNDKVEGTVVLRQPNGNPIHTFQVSASYALGGFGGGQDDARMNWLYEEFARLTTEEIEGGGINTDLAATSATGTTATPATIAGTAQYPRKLTSAEISDHFKRYSTFEAKSAGFSIAISMGPGNKFSYNCGVCFNPLVGGEVTMRPAESLICLKLPARNLLSSDCYEVIQTSSQNYEWRGRTKRDVVRYSVNP